MQIHDSRPIPGISPVDAVKRAVRKTFDYSGRASRSEYWWVAAATCGVAVPLVAADIYRFTKRQKALTDQGHTAETALTDGDPAQKKVDKFMPSPLTWIVLGACEVPMISLKVRRLHDSNISGWWLPLCDISPVKYYFFARDSRAEGKRFDR